MTVVLERFAEVGKNKALLAKSQELRKAHNVEDPSATDIIINGSRLTIIESFYKELIAISGEEISNEVPTNDGQPSIEADGIDNQESQDGNVTQTDINEATKNDADETLVADQKDMPVVEEYVGRNFAKPEVTAAAQKFSIQGYDITWIPKKSELQIGYKSEDDSNYMLKVIRGKMQSIDFALTENEELYILETSNLTPFLLLIEQNHIILEVHDGASATGLSHVFEMSK